MGASGPSRRCARTCARVPGVLLQAGQPGPSGPHRREPQPRGLHRRGPPAGGTQRRGTYWRGSPRCACAGRCDNSERRAAGSSLRSLEAPNPAAGCPLALGNNPPRPSLRESAIRPGRGNNPPVDRQRSQRGDPARLTVRCGHAGGPVHESSDLITRHPGRGVDRAAQHGLGGEPLRFDPYLGPSPPVRPPWQRDRW